MQPPSIEAEALRTYPLKWTQLDHHLCAMTYCAETYCCVLVLRFQRGLKRKPLALIKKLRKAKREAASGEKPEPVRTHLRNMIIVPEMIGSIIGVYNGKTFNQVGHTSQQPQPYGVQM